MIQKKYLIAFMLVSGGFLLSCQNGGGTTPNSDEQSEIQIDDNVMYSWVEPNHLDALDTVTVQGCFVYDLDINDSTFSLSWNSLYNRYYHYGPIENSIDDAESTQCLEQERVTDTVFINYGPTALVEYIPYQVLSIDTSALLAALDTVSVTPCSSVELPTLEGFSLSSDDLPQMFSMENNWESGSFYCPQPRGGYPLEVATEEEVQAHDSLVASGLLVFQPIRSGCLAEAQTRISCSYPQEMNVQLSMRSVPTGVTENRPYLNIWNDSAWSADTLIQWTLVLTDRYSRAFPLPVQTWFLRE